MPAAGDTKVKSAALIWMLGATDVPAPVNVSVSEPAVTAV